MEEARDSDVAFTPTSRFAKCSIPEQQRQYQKSAVEVSSALESNELKGAEPILCLSIRQLISQFLHLLQASRFVIHPPSGVSYTHGAIVSNLSTINSLQKDFTCSCQRLKCGQGKRESRELFAHRYSLDIFSCTIRWRSAAILRCVKQGDS